MCLLKVERVDRNHNYFVRLFFDDRRDLFDRVMLALPVLSETEIIAAKFPSMLDGLTRAFRDRLLNFCFVRTAFTRLLAGMFR